MGGEKVDPSDEHSTVREGWVLDNNSTFGESQGGRKDLCLHSCACTMKIDVCLPTCSASFSQPFLVFFSPVVSPSL